MIVSMHFNRRTGLTRTWINGELTRIKVEPPKKWNPFDPTTGEPAVSLLLQAREEPPQKQQATQKENA